MNKIILSALLLTLFISSATAAIIDSNSTATAASTVSVSTSTNSSLAITYTDTIIALNSTTTAIQQQLNYSLYLLQTGDFINPNSTLGSAIQRVYPNGTTQYQLFIEYVDEKFNIQEYDSTVRLIAADAYFLTQFSSYGYTGGNSTNSDPIPAPTYIVAPSATSLTDLVNKLTVGYSLLNSTQLSLDKQIAVIDGYFKNLYPISGATLSYGAQLVSGKETRYRVFYALGSGSSFHFKIGQAIYNQDYKTLFIHSLLQIQIPSSLVPQ